MRPTPDAQLMQLRRAAARREARDFALTLAGFLLAAKLLGRLGALDALGGISPPERGPVTARWLAAEALSAAGAGAIAYALWLGLMRVLRRLTGAR